MKRTVALIGSILILASLLWAAELQEGWVVYRGRARSPRWVAQQYAYFKDKIAQIDGAYYSVASAHVAAKCWRPMGDRTGFWTIQDGDREPARLKLCRGTAPVGTPGILTGEVFQITGSATMLVRTESYSEIRVPLANRVHYERKSAGEWLYYVDGLPTGRLVDGQALPLQEDRDGQKRPYCFVVAGSTRYTTAIGATKTVTKLRALSTIAKLDFIKALKQGIILERWQGRRIACPRCKERESWSAAYRKARGPCEECAGKGRAVGFFKSEVQ